MIFQNKKNAFLGYKNKKFKKSKNCHFSKGVNPWFWSKNDHFSRFFSQAIYNRKMSFTIFQYEKTPFQAIKTRSSKSRKIDIFPKGSKNGRFSNFSFLASIEQENVFYDILETHGFAPKMAIFPTFFLRQYRTGKCLLRYSDTKKRISRL